jgi:hypothetical protein
MERIVAWHYVGGGDYLFGVPARDLTADEYEQHREHIKANVLATGKRLYVPAAEDSEPTKPESKGKGK